MAAVVPEFIGRKKAIPDVVCLPLTNNVVFSIMYTQEEFDFGPEHEILLLHYFSQLSSL